MNWITNQQIQIIQELINLNYVEKQHQNEHIDNIFQLVKKHYGRVGKTYFIYIIPEKNYYRYGTLLHAVCSLIDDEWLIRYISQKCPSFEVFNDKYEAPIHNAVMYGRSFRIVKFIYEKTPEEIVLTKTKEGFNTYEYASFGNVKPEIYEYMLQQKSIRETNQNKPNH